MKPKIGILGGIGPESSALFYKQLIQLVQSKNIKSNTEYPHIILESIPAPELLLKNPDLSMYKETLRNLEKAGADFIVIICNTAYVFIDQFENLVNISILDLNKETKMILDKNNVKKITIFGSKKTTDKLFHFDNIKIESISENDAAIIDQIILQYNSGKNKKESEQQLINLIKKYPQKNVLIACTELSTILKNTGLKYLDTFDILLNATFQKWKTLKP
ncbi:aspartate/glutamate racemase family protein [archaeon]|nr:aspartate/glutamate racemase family protein [archaeon]